MNNSNKVISLLEEEPGGHITELGISKKETLVRQDWYSDYKNSLKDVDALPQVFNLKDEEKGLLREVSKLYHMRIPHYFLSLIKEPDNPRDPIRMQCVPSLEELRDGIYDTIDPLGEEKTSPLPCLVHRYPDRVLFLVTGHCFMYCRHCTRKRLWRENTPLPTQEDYERALDYIKQNKEIREVIISGGDPLTLQTEKLDYILSSIAWIKNIEVVRIGTRTPVVLPKRIDNNLCKMLEQYGNLWINVQFNHPREITPQSTFACRRLQKCGIPLSNQSVLLKGINDNPEVMTELCHKLQSIKVRPYYLFQCDPVVGASHFRTSVWRGVEIIERMRGYTSGMCIPTFVIDGTDGKGKIPLEPNYLVSRLEDGVMLKNYKNETFFYYSPEETQRRIDKVKGSNKISTIGIVFNLKRQKDDERDEEYDEPETVGTLRKEIEKCGFNAVIIEQDRDLIDNLLKSKPDFVLNIAEGIGCFRSRESQVPSVLESLGIPYSGSDPISLGITLDKHLTHNILSSASIPVPRSYVVNNEEDIDRLKDIFKSKQFFIVKPCWEGSSKGIFSNSIVDNFKDLKERVAFIVSTYKQSALVEEFLEGEEITVGVAGNTKPYILGMMRVLPRDASEGMFIYSIEVKRDWQKRVKYEPERTIPKKVQNKISNYALMAFSALELRDIARMDFRLDRDNIPRIIDINPLPGLSSHYSDLPILYRLNGGDYSDLIKIVLKESFARYGFRYPY